ncbi:MAG TPA: DUF255 domain-containing protein, partial [Marmoricola sp.]|nr:DUF255 domain-containing protein [Marmoricola sp.]
MANRLVHATSPYLLQHAENPVDWWEWGQDAFAAARRRDVPVLLSVGYAACHWCHVIRGALRVGILTRDPAWTDPELGRLVSRSAADGHGFRTSLHHE